MKDCTCFGCDFYDSDCESCTCPLIDMWYACPIESEKPENQKELEVYAKLFRKGEQKK